MSTIEVPDIFERATARIGSAYQRAALSRLTPRPPLNRYQPERAPWAHGFWPGQDHRLGKWHPADAPIAQFLESLPPETCQQAYERLLARRRELEALGYVFERPVPNACVLPEPTPGPPGTIPRPPRPPVRPPVRPPITPRPPTEETYKILDTGGVLSLISRNTITPATTDFRVQIAHAAHPGPILATAITWQLSAAAGAAASVALNIPQLAWGLACEVNEGSGTTPFANGTIPLHSLLRAGATLDTRSEPFAIGDANPDIMLALSYRNVSGLRPRPPLPPDDPGAAFLVECGPFGMQLPEVCLALEDAGLLPPGEINITPPY